VKKLKLLLILPFLLMTACNTDIKAKADVDLEDYDKVHIYEIGCVPKESCRKAGILRGCGGMVLIEYTDPDGNLFATSSYALVKGDCPICDK
jgi:hypothetical protein